MGSSGSKGGDAGTVIVCCIGLLIAFWVVAWPYYLGTWLAVKMGAENPSEARTVAGWSFEVVWLVVLASFVGWGWRLSEREKEEKLRRELAERQREADLGPAGMRIFKEAEAAVASIAESEAARSGWLGDASEFDFRADLDAIADNLRRSHEIRNVTADAASIKNVTKSDARMLKDAQRAIAGFDDSVNKRLELIKGCAEQASDIDRVLREERENVEMEKQRKELRDRLSPILYNADTAPTEEPSEAADTVSARVSAFHELKALIDSYRIEG